MFQELMPILTDRPLTITVSTIGADKTQLRVNIVPLAVEGDSKLESAVTAKGGVTKENVAVLHKPLVVIGTPAELDTELGPALIGFADKHKSFAESLKDLQASLEEADKAEKAAKDAATKARQKTVAGKKDEKKPEPKKSEPKTEEKPLKNTVQGKAQAPDDFMLWDAADDANNAVQELPPSAPAGEEVPVPPPDEDIPVTVPDHDDDGIPDFGGDE